MKTGFDMLLWTTHVTEEHFPLLESIKKVGYDGVEIPIFEGDTQHFEKVGNQNHLRPEDIERIVSAYRKRESIKKFSHFVSIIYKFTF